MKASRGEIKIYEILKDAELNFKEEYSIAGLNSPNGRPLRFDFAVFTDDGDLDFLIEFQGAQHYRPSPKFGGRRGLYRQQYNDNQKRRYCQEHNIKLIAIPYFDEPKLSYDYIMREAGY